MKYKYWGWTTPISFHVLRREKCYNCIFISDSFDNWINLNSVAERKKNSNRMKILLLFAVVYLVCAANQSPSKMKLQTETDSSKVPCESWPWNEKCVWCVTVCSCLCIFLCSWMHTHYSFFILYMYKCDLKSKCVQITPCAWNNLSSLSFPNHRFLV